MEGGRRFNTQPAFTRRKDGQGRPPRRGIEKLMRAARRTCEEIQTGVVFMSITLNHTIVPAHDKVASAKFFANLFGLRYEGPMGHFAPVRVNETFTLDFDDQGEGFDVHHYAFQVSEEEFDIIFGRIKEAGLNYGSAPWTPENMQVGNMQSFSSSGAGYTGGDAGGRIVYFRELGGHLLEIRTRA
jgi:catechol 2,3-dioxygenase-like lactoylglutathione lyase family enzyme